MSLLHIALVTLGKPTRQSGGYLYHLRLAELAPRYGARIEFVSFPEWPFPLASLSAPRVMRQAGQAQAILLDSIAAALVAPYWMWRKPPVPVLGILHQGPGGIGQGRWRSWLQRPLDRLAYRFTRKLLVASQSLRDELVGDGFDSRRLEVVAPGCNVANRVDRVPQNLRGSSSVAVLCVGNWARMKDTLSLLEAFAAIPAEAARLHLVGDTDADPSYGASVWARLRQADLRDRVVVHGVLPREQVAALYAGCDVFVLPSLRETYGTVYSEAMACGLPVVGWTTGNLPYLATHEQEGLVLEPGDIGALSGALLRLARDPALRQRLGQAARRRAQLFPSWEETTRRVVEAVRSEL